MIQPALCADKSAKTDFSIIYNETESSYDAYLGVALLERVNISGEDIQHKMLVGRLYNADVKRVRLRETFGHDNRTMKKWGEALRSGDINEIARAFAGRAVNKKISPELIRYVKQLYRERERFGRAYRRHIIQKVEEVFAVRLSASYISSIFSTVDDGDIISKNSQETPSEKSGIVRQSDGLSSLENDASVYMSPIFPCLSKEDNNSFNANVLIHHAGLFLFGFWLYLYSALSRQIICQLLQGAVNIEQSKSLCYQSLAYFSKPLLPGLRQQRQALDRDASEENILELYRKNSELLCDGPGKGKLFLFDPHTKAYTGQLKTLRGWCGSLHAPAKVINLDCFHTQSGRPCYIRHYSPYYDMRERFFMGLILFDQLFDEDDRCGRTFVIDRGIYGLETLRNFKNDYVITWEKNFNSGDWDERNIALTFTRSRCRNNRSDLKHYTFECYEQRWKRDGSFRRILVRLTTVNRKPLIVSIISNNPDMDIQDIVWAIFNRWLQENDFKYLDTHFGINQLDSRSHGFFTETTKDLHRDRIVKSEEYRAVEKELKSTETTLAKCLLKLNKLHLKTEDLHQQKLILEKTIEDLGQRRRKNALKTARKTMGNLKRSITAAGKSQQKLEFQKDELQKHSQSLEEKLCHIIKTTSYLQLLIKNETQYIDTRRKALMDALRVNAANMFRNLHESYRVICNNYRDDHDRLRMLTRSSGLFRRTDKNCTLKLWLPGTIQPHVIRSMQTFVNQIETDINRINSDFLPLKIELQTGPIGQ